MLFQQVAEVQYRGLVGDILLRPTRSLQTGAPLNKIHLPREQYLVVQQIYRGWALWGIAIFGALAATLVLTFMSRGNSKQFTLSLLAFLCLVVTQVIFWLFTFPVNQATVNWTIAPDNWLELRRQWEYSHAAAGLFNLLALVLVILSVL